MLVYLNYLYDKVMTGPAAYFNQKKAPGDHHADYSSQCFCMYDVFSNINEYMQNE